MPKSYLVALSAEQRQRCEQLLGAHRASARERTRARVLLLADTLAPAGAQTDLVISERAHTSLATVGRIRHRFVQGGLAVALYHHPQEKRKEPVLDGAAEAHLIATVCGAPPAGRKRWSLHLLQDKLIEAGYVDTVSHETVRQRLKKTNLSLG